MDIVDRLRDRAYASKIPDPLCEQAAAEIERLREYLELSESELSIARLRSNSPGYTAGISAAPETKNHDAAPAATAHSSGNDGPSPDSHGTGGTPVTNPMPKKKRAEVSCTPLAAGGRAACGRAEAATPDSPSLSGAPVTDGRPAPTAEPVAWAVVSDSKEDIDCEFVYPDEATAGDVALDINGGVVPLYRHPSPCPYVTGTVTRYCTLTPFTLTDAEREAVEEAIRRLWGFDIAATLRGLLERTGGER